MANIVIILDLIICNDESWINEIYHLPPVGYSDHDVIYVSLNVMNTNNESDTNNFYDYFKGNYDQCRSELNSINWDEMANMNVEEAWGFLKRNIKEVESRYVPLKMNKKANNNRSPWVTRDVIRAINKKRRLFKHFLRCKSSISYDAYIQCRNTTKSLIRSTVRSFERKIAQESKCNVKSF